MIGFRSVGHGAPDVRSVRRRSASRPGRSPCSMNSSDAPPPVLTWSTRSASPNWRIAAALSPPPTTVKPGQSATASATRAGPGGERRHLEHAHRAVPEHGRRAARSRRRTSPRSPDRRRGPSSRRGSRRRATIRVSASSAMSCGDHDVGRDLHPAGGEQARALVDHVGLHERVADGEPSREEERERHRAADEHRVAAVEQRVDHAELVADLGAAEHRDERPVRLVEQPRRAPRPRGAAAARPRSAGRAAGRRSTRAPGATRRTPRSRSASSPSARFVAKAGIVAPLARLEAQVLEHHDAAGTRRSTIGSTLGPNTRGASGTRRPSSSPRCAATGAIEYCGSASPFGRPRCPQATTAAPRSRSHSIVGQRGRRCAGRPRPRRRAAAR